MAIRTEGPVHDSDSALRVVLALADPDRATGYVDRLGQLGIPGSTIERLTSARDAVESMRDGRCDLAILDDALLDGGSRARLGEITRESPDLVLVLVAAGGNVNPAHLDLERTGVRVFQHDPDSPGEVSPQLESLVTALKGRRVHRPGRKAPPVQEAKRRSGLAFDDAAVGMAVLGPDGRIQRVNAAWCFMLDTDAGTLVGARLTEVCHPDDAAVTGAQVGGLLSGRAGGFRLELRFPTRGGTVLHGGLTAAPLDGGEHPLQILAMLVDLTPERMATLALRETSAALSTLLDTGKWEEAAARFAAVAAEQTGCPCGFAGVLESDGALKVVGPIPAYPAPVSHPRCVRVSARAASAGDAAGLDRLLARVVVIGKPVVTGDLTWSPASWLHPEDGRAWQRLLAIPVLKGRRVVGVLAVVAGPGEFSGTERFILENLARGGAALFAGQARLRRLPGPESRSRQVETMRTIRTFTAGISHHFNNLLQIMMGCAQLAERQLPRDHASLSSLRTIIQTGTRTGDLIRQLAACGEFAPPRRERIDPNQAIRMALPLLKECLGESVEVVASLAPELDPVEIGATDLERLLVVLAQNAADAMPGGGTFTLETRSCRHDEIPGGLSGPCLSICARDTGCGMEAPVLERVFEPFFTTKNMALRAGLGLTTVYALVEAAGGRIEIESTVRAGSTIRIYLPTRPAPRGPGPSAPLEPERLSPGTPRVMVVADEPAVRSLVAQSLSRQGYVIFEAGTGEQALRLWQGKKELPDLVVTDISLPGMSGLELVRALRAEKPDVRILYITGHTLDVLAGIEHRGAGEAVLHKPFDLNALQALAASLLAGGDPSDRSAR